MWPFTSYPEATAAEVDGREYDYIIVGGGTAGCVLASRLSEDPGVSVLVLEKGRVKDNMVSRIPLLSQTFYLYDLLQVQSTRYSEPIPTCDEKRTHLWTAEGVGGATRINGMLLTRGVPGGFNEWAGEMGLDDWSWEKVEPYFRRSENAVAHPGAEWRGHDGPIEVRQRGVPFIATKYMEKACAAVGLPSERDCNRPDAPAMGLFSLDVTIDKHGRRLSAYRAWLNRQIARERRSRLTVCTGVVASKLELDAQAGIVTGVHIVPAKPDLQGNQREYFVKAKREVIVCTGTMCTPQLLMLSGIGPKEQLQKHGVPLVKDLPQVGSNFSDHYSFPIMLQLPKLETLHILESAWALWYILLWLFFGVGLLASSSTPSTIFVRTTALDDETMDVRARDDDRDGSADNMDASQPRNIPDCEIMLTPVNCFDRPIPGHSMSSLYTTLVQPFSRGRVELASTEPRANPRIIYPLLTDPRDTVVMRRAIRFTLRLAEEFDKSGYPYPAPVVFGPGVNTATLEDLYSSSEPPASPVGWLASTPEPQAALVAGAAQLKPVPDAPAPAAAATPTQDKKEAKKKNEKPLVLETAAQAGKSWRTVTDEEIDAYARRVAVSSLHFSSTCRMASGEGEGVVDQRLRVFGFRNLRVADASVFPKVPSAHTMAATVMVAERCADFVKEERGERKVQ
ncbi:Alcohol oxidase [Pleurostoma richardsiae]|uniref:Alcohol oxidase n=1 Tax=Pleurostoma richardsiae TaxID=41990 RepID=A0AA38RLY5_9PEZI|nr:Alcohol oxidase [Pleurostoma richardsiae]